MYGVDDRSLVKKLTRRGATGILLGLGGALAAACGQSAGQTGSAAPAGSGKSGAAGAPASTTGVAFANPSLVVDVNWLRQHIKDANVRVVDARPSAEFDKGHIPGAVSLPVTETFDPSKDKNYPDTKEKLESLLGSKGIGNTLRVITYDAGDGKATQASRLFWTLEYLGHKNVAVLDGGVNAWEASKGELSTEAPAVPAAKFTSAVDPAKMPTKEQCELAIGDKTKVVLDSRSEAEYRGEDVRAKFGGHIPGAVNIDYRLNFSGAGTLKSAAELKSLYEGKGVTKDKEIIAHCQTGQRSSVSYWVLRMLGYPKVGNYAGSWIEWGNDPSTKKEKA